VTTGSDARDLSAETSSGERARLERHALGVFAVGALTMAIICGAVIVSGWFAGVIRDDYERVFWAGALLAGLMVAVLAGAAWPGGRDDRRVVARIRLLTRVGLVLFVLAPALCIGALVADFFF
jgi:hypothetical protein